MTDLTEEQRRLQHRPSDAASLRAEALRLQAEGMRIRDIAQIIGMNDAAVIALLSQTDSID